MFDFDSVFQQVAHWQRLYLHEKRKTADLEQNCLHVRHDLENLHRRIMSKAQTSGLPVGYAKEAPSKKVGLPDENYCVLDIYIQQLEKKNIFWS
jgi:hypothetical protein